MTFTLKFVDRRQSLSETHPDVEGWFFPMYDILRSMYIKTFYAWFDITIFRDPGPSSSVTLLPATDKTSKKKRTWESEIVTYLRVKSFCLTETKDP